MKLISSTSALLGLYTAQAALTRLDPELADELSEEVDPRKYTGIMDMAFHKLRDHPDFLPTTDASQKRKIFQKMIENYGCHCFPQHKSTAGGWGKPVDAMDEACRSLYRCQKCVNIEYPGACDTIDGGYKYDLIADADKSVSCDAPPRIKECASQQCSCDREFANQIYSIWVESSWEHNPHYWHHPANMKIKAKNGDPVFDRDATCKMGNNVAPDACCGDSYPNKVPYNTNEKACCNSAAKAYNAAMEICCDSEGTVVNASKGCF